MNKLGERLREERKRCGLSQQAIAMLGGVQPNAQGHYESGNRTPRADYLTNVSGTIDIGYVVTGSKTSGESSALSSDESAMILALRKMNALDQEALTHVVGVMNRSAVPDGALPEMMNLGSGTCTEQRKSMLR